MDVPKSFFPKIAAKSSQASHPLGNHGSLGIESGACPHKTEHFLLPTLSLAAIISSEIFFIGKNKMLNWFMELILKNNVVDETANIKTAQLTRFVHDKP